MEDRLSNTKRKQLPIVHQFLSFGIGPILGMFISMLTVPVTTRLLSPEEYGKSSLFTLFQSLFLIVGLLGFDQGYVRFYNDKKIKKSELLQNSLFLPLCFSIFLILICSAFFKSISNFLFGSVEIGLMVAFCFFIPVLLFNRFFLLQIRMDLNGKLYSLLNIISQIINFLVLIFFLLFYQKTFKSIVYATIFGFIANTFIIFLFIDKSFIKNKFVFSKEIQKKLLKFSLPLVPATLLSWLLNSFDKIGLRTWSNFNELGLYATAFKIVAILNVFQNIFTTTWIPIAYRWKEDNVSKEKFEQISSIVLSMMTCLFAFVVLFRDIIFLFFGSEYRNSSDIFVFLLFIPVMYTISETTCLGINFSKRTLYNLYVSIIVVVLNLLGNYFLIPKYGALGASLSTCMSYIVFFWGRTFFSRKEWFKFGLTKYIVNQILLISFGINMIFFESKIIEISIFVFVLLYNILINNKIFLQLKKNYD